MNTFALAPVRGKSAVLQWPPLPSRVEDKHEKHVTRDRTSVVSSQGEVDHAAWGSGSSWVDTTRVDDQATPDASLLTRSLPPATGHQP